MKTKTAAIVIGVVFIVVGLLGFFPNPIIADSESAIFHADSVHSIVHIVSGVLFLIFAYAIPDRTPAFLKIFGVIYFLIGVIGLINVGSTGMGKILGFLHVNGADNYLHIVLGLVIFFAGMLAPNTPERTP
jgi:hypothetical protein